MAETPLTDSQFWDVFWEDIKLPDLINQQVQWQRALTQAFQRHLPLGQGCTLFEIGCAPGRWLAWFNKVMGYTVAGCDFSPQGIKLTQWNLQMNRVEGQVFQADILTDPLPEDRYDVVISLGLIEQFEHPEQVIARHVALLKPGGLLVLEVPNMAGWLNRRLLLMAGLDDLLAVHNLTVMNRRFLRSVADTFGLKTRYLGYIGGFDPGLILYNYNYGTGSRSQLLARIWRRKHVIILLLWLFERVLRRVPQFAGRINAAAYSHM
ncbi:MAG: class I SAM-dependent methyltransferase, partial [Chloroflexales bacterium]